VREKNDREEEEGEEEQQQQQQQQALHSTRKYYGTEYAILQVHGKKYSILALSVRVLPVSRCNSR
jgi:hypothetical protein